jgi:aspartate aminotransferase/aminotransferase
MSGDWIASRALAFDSSGIRRIFELAAKMERPINLSIGQPDFEVPGAVQEACIEAVCNGRNGYAPTQGIPALRERLQADVQRRWGDPERRVFVTSGTSGALVLAMLALVNPGDEVIIFDPFFVMYEPLVQLVGGVPVLIDTYPEFQIDPERVRRALTPRTKLILLNSPGNPTGAVATEQQVRELAELAARHRVALISDEIYGQFCYGQPVVSPVTWNPETIVIDGFSKSHAMTGWRVGYVHGPRLVMDAMLKLQQYTFVCAPQPAQWGAARALDVDIRAHVDEYRQKRDRLLAGIQDLYAVVAPAGAFYVFPAAPRGSGTEFVERALEQQLLVIPGKVFSRRDTHFRISYAAPNETIDRGIEVLRRLAR